MARFVAGDVVVLPFPFTDLASSKVRPALVLAASTPIMKKSGSCCSLLTSSARNAVRK